MGIINSEIVKQKKFYIKTYGCQMNEADSEVVASIMGMDGYVVTEDENDADLFLLNTCSVRDNAEQKVLSYLMRLRAEKSKRGKGLIIGVIGCMAERMKEELIYKYDVDVSYSKNDKFRVSLTNKTNNRKQIILKNQDVYAILRIFFFFLRI